MYSTQDGYKMREVELAAETQQSAAMSWRTHSDWPLIFRGRAGGWKLRTSLWDNVLWQNVDVEDMLSQKVSSLSSREIFVLDNNIPNIGKNILR